jgi:predicted metallopeptidase
MRRGKKKYTKVDWVAAPDIRSRLGDLVTRLELDWIDMARIYTVRSEGSSARAYARVWGMSRVWQVAAGLPAVYCVEVVSQYFDKLPTKEQDKVLLHELAHIPKNFSGALVAHNHVKGGFHDKLKGMLAAYNKIAK